MESVGEVIRHFLLRGGENKIFLIDRRKALMINYFFKGLKFRVRLKIKDPRIAWMNWFREKLA